MTTIARGNTGRLRVTFAPVAGTVSLVDVLCSVTSPSLVTSTLTAVADGTNRFYADVAVGDLAELGQWTVRWDSNPPSELITVSGSYNVVAFPVTVARRTSVGQVMERIRRELNATLRYEISVLAANVSDTATVLTLAYDLPPSLQEGAIVAIGTEVCRVMAINAASKEVTVLRGFFDSTPADHDTDDEVQINPRFLSTSVFEAMHDELASWPQGLYRLLTFQGSNLSSADTIELPAAWSNIYGLVDVRGRAVAAGTTTSSFRRIDGRIVRADPSEWSEGPTSGIYFRPIESLCDGTLLFTAAAPFDLASFETTDDLVDDCGMQASMLDVLTIGVKIRLMPDQEIGRSERRGQDDSRRAEEVPPEAAIVPVRTLMPTYIRRRAEEIAKLTALYPIRSS